jgi:hypothetical protein
MRAISPADQDLATGRRWGTGLRAPLAVLGAAGAAVAYLGAVDPNAPGHYPTCPFLFVTGLNCPGCGSLRALHALAHGDLATAMSRNPLTLAGIGVLAFLWVAWLRRSVTGAPRRWAAPPWMLHALLGLVLIFWVLRNLPGFVWLAP